MALHQATSVSCLLVQKRQVTLASKHCPNHFFQVCSHNHSYMAVLLHISHNIMWLSVYKASVPPTELLWDLRSQKLFYLFWCIKLKYTLSICLLNKSMNNSPKEGGGDYIYKLFQEGWVLRFNFFVFNYMHPIKKTEIKRSDRKLCKIKSLLVGVIKK